MNDHECDFEVAEDSKIIALSGALNVSVNDCKLLNLAIASKNLFSDCGSSEFSISYRDVIRDKFEIFNPMKGDHFD
jgi:hypothetical protein